MNGDAESCLTLVASTYPKLADLVENIRLYLTSKLYHELTGALTTLLADKSLSCDVKIEIFETVVHPHKDSFNLLRFCTLLKYSSDSLEPKAALEHLSKYDPFLERDVEAHIMLQIAKSYHYVVNGQLKECDTLLDTVRDKVTTTFNLGLDVHSAFYHASANMHWALKDYSRAYNDWKMFLSYTSINDIPENERTSVAVALTISAIVSTDSFGFGEVIHQPIVETYLKGGEENWLYDLLHIFNEGQLDLFDEMVEKHKGKFVHSELNGHLEQMRHKLTLIVLLNLVFFKPNRQRTIHFDEIVKHCGIQHLMVEPFVLQAFARGLIKGYIDEVEQLVYVSWVQPRILDINKLEVLNKRIQDWADHIDNFALKLKQQVQDEANGTSTAGPLLA